LAEYCSTNAVVMFVDISESPIEVYS